LRSILHSRTEEVSIKNPKNETNSLGTATTTDEAEALEQLGDDVVVASGFEAGGHRGSFLRSPEDSLAGTSARA
jgi:NAD(P)H-dependent flavin oxidoreductase YrpB (nitropropane dioxygenase family)